MGNAGYHHFLSVEHPTSVSCSLAVHGGYEGKPFSAGKNEAPNIVSMYNQAECATGCGGTFTFQHHVKTLRATYECKSQFKSAAGVSFEAGLKQNVFGASEGSDEKLQNLGFCKLGVSLNLTREEVTTYFIATEYEVTDLVLSSTAYIYHCYNNYDWVEFKWLRNEIKLTPSGKDATFSYKEKTYLKLHPDHCKGDKGPHVGYEGLNSSNVQSDKSSLRVLHEGGRHTAFVKIAFDEKYMKNGVLSIEEIIKDNK